MLFAPVQQKLTALEESLMNGKELDKDQREAVTKLPDVSVQLDLARDFQKQFQSVQVEVKTQLRKKAGSRRDLPGPVFSV